MASLDHITVATDLSPQAELAVARTLQLAEQHAASLLAVSVVPPIESDLDTHWGRAQEVTARELQARLRAETEQRLRGSIADAGGTDAVARVVESREPPFLEIVHAARAENAGLIVVGAHGGHFLHRLLVGTTAERVVRHADRPVLVVKQPPQGLYRKVLVPVDFSALSEAALAFATKLAPQADVSVVHSYELWFESWIGFGKDLDERVLALRDQIEREARNRLAEAVSRAGLEPKSTPQLVRYGYPGRIITHVAQDRGVDLIVMGTHGRSMLEQALLGSVAEHVLKECQCDVLLVPPADKDRSPASG